MSTADELREESQEKDDDVQRGVYAIKYFREEGDVDVIDFLSLIDHFNTIDGKRLHNILEPIVTYGIDATLSKYFEVIKDEAN